MSRLRILSWNIRHGGGRRLPAIAEAIRRHNPDVAVINETRARTMPQLLDALRSCGLEFSISSAPIERESGILVASRRPLEAEPHSKPRALVPHGLLEVRLRGPELTVGAVYGPMLSPKHDRFWRAMLRHARSQLDRPYLMIGDFNAGESFVDTERYKFKSKEFVSIRALGFVDAWRAEHGDTREYTWFSFGRGNAQLNGFRLDHALASPALAGHLSACRYSHSERESKLSDHSILLLECDIASLEK